MRKLKEAVLIRVIRAYNFMLEKHNSIFGLIRINSDFIGNKLGVYREQTRTL